MSETCDRCGREVEKTHLVSRYEDISWAHIFYSVCESCYREYSKLVSRMMEIGPGSGFITIAEEHLAEELGRCWNLYTELPGKVNGADEEFAHAIHQAQNIVLARASLRQLHSKKKDGE